MFAYFVLSISQTKKVDRLCHIPKQRGNKKIKIKHKPIYTFIHEDFFSLTRTVEDEERGTTSTLQVVHSSAALVCEATLSLATGASSGAHARFGGHAASRWWSPAVPHHSTSHGGSGASGASLVAPHVPAVVSSPPGLSLAHRPRLLLLHIQAHLASEHDRLQGENRSQLVTKPARDISLMHFTTHIVHWFAHTSMSTFPRYRIDQSNM